MSRPIARKHRDVSGAQLRAELSQMTIDGLAAWDHLRELAHRSAIDARLDESIDCAAVAFFDALDGGGG